MNSIVMIEFPTWWGQDFNLFLGGIAAIVAGIAAVSGAQYLMKVAEVLFSVPFAPYSICSTF